jgi:hypothetical protein
MSSSEVTDLIVALRAGSVSLDEVADRFRWRTWPRTRRAAPESYEELAAAAQLDPDADVPGSYDDVTAAYDRGELTSAEYDVLSEAVAESIRAEAGKARNREPDN